LVDQHVGRFHALAKSLAVHKSLENRTRLATRLLHMVESIGFVIAAADPGLDLAAFGIHGQKTGLQIDFLRAQLPHEDGIGLQLTQRLFRITAGVNSFAPRRRFADESARQRLIRTPQRRRTPEFVRHFLQLLGLPAHCCNGLRLQTDIQRGVHDKPVVVEVVIVTIGPVDQPFAQVLREVRRDAERFRLAFKVDPQRFFLQSF